MASQAPRCGESTADQLVFNDVAVVLIEVALELVNLPKSTEYLVSNSKSAPEDWKDLIDRPIVTEDSSTENFLGFVGEEEANQVEKVRADWRKWPWVRDEVRLFESSCVFEHLEDSCIPTYEARFDDAVKVLEASQSHPLRSSDLESISCEPLDVDARCFPEDFCLR